MGKDTESRDRRCGGFTLLETVMALTIASIALLFFTGFLVPQLKLYYRFGRTSEAKQVCGRIYREIEEQLRYGYDFAVDPEDPATLYYRVRETERSGDEYRSGVGEDGPLQFDGALLDEGQELGMRLELDFTGTDEDAVCVRIQLLEENGDEVIWEQRAYVSSLYGEREEGKPDGTH